MNNPQRSPWNSLEIVKLAALLLTPLLLFWLAYSINDSIREGELSRQQSKNEQLLSQQRQSAVQKFSKFIYERRSRSELLSSALRRHENEPVQQSMLEVVERKKLYDEAYHHWNTHHQANLLLIRKILDSSSYSKFEGIVESRLVLQTFKPLDSCLTKAYDAAIRNRDPLPILDQCRATDLIQQALDCGYAITDGLFRLSVNGDRRNTVGFSVHSRCPS